MNYSLSCQMPWNNLFRGSLHELRENPEILWKREPRCIWSSTVCKALKQPAKSIMNPQNDDEYCFFYCVAVHIFADEINQKSLQKEIKNGIQRKIF